MQTKQEIMTIWHVARKLGVSQSKVRRLADSGAIPCTRTADGTRLFFGEDVERYIRKNGRKEEV